MLSATTRVFNVFTGVITGTNVTSICPALQTSTPLSKGGQGGSRRLVCTRPPPPFQRHSSIPPHVVSIFILQFSIFNFQFLTAAPAFPQTSPSVETFPYREPPVDYFSDELGDPV